MSKRPIKVYNTSKDTNPVVKEHVRGVLKAIFSQSEVARIAYEERIVKVGTPGAQELFDN